MCLVVVVGFGAFACWLGCSVWFVAGISAGLVIALRLSCLRFGLRIHCVLVGWFGGFWRCLVAAYCLVACILSVVWWFGYV